MRGLAPGQRHWGLGGKGGIGGKGGACEGFLQPSGAGGGQGGQAQGGGRDILAKDLAGVDQQDAILAQTGTGRLQMADVLGQVQAKGGPAEFGRREALGADRLGRSAGFLGRGAEQDRGVGQFGMRLFLAQQRPDRFAPRATEQMSQGNRDPRPGMRGLE